MAFVVEDARLVHRPRGRVGAAGVRQEELRGVDLAGHGLAVLGGCDAADLFQDAVHLGRSEG